MTASALSTAAADLPVGGVWTLSVLVTDVDGDAVTDVPVITVTSPAGTTSQPAVETVATGVYRAEVIVATPGRYVARAVSASHGAADFAAFVTTITAAGAMPALADVRAYLGGDSFTDAELQDALDAESAAQRAACRVGPDYSADLRHALMRRVARNLAMRKLPLAIGRGDAEAGDAVFLPGRDQEIRRLEAPYRKLVFG